MFIATVFLFWFRVQAGKLVQVTNFTTVFTDVQSMPVIFTLLSTASIDTWFCFTTVR